MFGSPVLPQPGIGQPPPPSGAPGRAPFDPSNREGNYFDRLGGPLPPPPAGAPPVPPPVPGAAAPGIVGPSEFTRVVSAVQRPITPPPTTAPPVRPPPPAKKGSDRALIIGLVAVLVLAIAFVVVILVVG